MKIRSVRFDNRRQAFHVAVGTKTYELPYSAMGGRPRRLRVTGAFVDPELGREGFTFETDSGEVGAVHVDNVLLVNGDLRAGRENTLYNLTIAAMDAMRESGISKRAVARRLATSMSQIARLLDPKNRTKSVEQMMALLGALGRDVEIVVRRRKPGTAA